MSYKFYGGTRVILGNAKKNSIILFRRFSFDLVCFIFTEVQTASSGKEVSQRRLLKRALIEKASQIGVREAYPAKASSSRVAKVSSNSSQRFNVSSEKSLTKCQEAGVAEESKSEEPKAAEREVGGE